MTELKPCRVFVVIALIVLLAFTSGPGGASADARANYLVRLLQASSQFRVRAQAAISLGVVGQNVQVEDALMKALRDEHPAVRAAAATSLGRVGSSRSVSRLRIAQRDVEKPVRTAASNALTALLKASGQAGQAVSPDVLGLRYYVALSPPKGGDLGLSEQQVRVAERYFRQKVAALDGVEVAPKDESPKQARRVLKKRKLIGYFLEGAITAVQEKPGGGTRVAVSLILSTYPGRNMRAMLRGAATAVGGRDGNFEQALEGAITGALRKLPQALGR